MSFTSPVPRLRAPKLGFKQHQRTSYPIILTGRPTYTRSSSCTGSSSRTSSSSNTSSSSRTSTPISSSRNLLATELDWWGLASRETSSSKESLQGSLTKLGRLADRCEGVNSRLEHIITDNHRILDNSFLASQVSQQHS